MSSKKQLLLAVGANVGQIVRPHRTPVASYPEEGKVYTIVTEGPFQIATIVGHHMTLRGGGRGIEGDYDPRRFYRV